MTEQQTPVMTPPAPPAAPKKKKRKKGRAKTIVGLIIALAVVAALIFAVWYLVFRDDTALGNPMTTPVYRGSIQTTVEGSGLTKAKDSATVTPGTGTLLELYVHEGDQVTAGQQLYRMDDSAAREEVNKAQEAVNDAQEEVNRRAEELQDARDKLADLTLTAPHAGNLREVADLQLGDTVNEGDTIATIVDDTRLRLSLYYSYAYENAIQVGQSAQISIPAILSPVTGTVEQINKVRFVSPEGAVHFEVVFVLDNPGTLTEGMDASAGLTVNGAPVYPYQSGKLEYYETTAVKAKATGPVEAFSLLDYADVKAGQVLLQLGTEDADEEISNRQDALQTAQEALKTAQEQLNTATEELGKYNATAPISGTVLQCSLVEGEEVTSGQAITIADTSVMTIEIQVDERNVQYVTTGMPVDINYNGSYFMGTVLSVAMTGTAENGMSTFPAIVQVDNPDGTIMSNSYASYSFVASQSNDCLLVPTIAVKYVSFANLGAGGMTGDGAATDDGLMADDGGVVAVPQSYSGGASAQPLMAVAVPMPGGASAQPLMAVAVPMPGGASDSSMGGSMSGSMGGDDSTGYVVFVKADEAPDNAILEPDPAWGCPEGFWTVPVEVGISDTTQVEILSGLNEGDEVFIGYENPDEVMGSGYYY